MFEGKVILIVDDDPTLLEMYVERIRSEGAVVLQAIDGEDALVKARENHPNLIMLDVMMPKLNGLEVLGKLKADLSTWEIPVIILSALNDIEKKKAGISLGAVDYIVKSESLPSDVVEKIRSILFPESVSL
ncbi:MAG: response regulator [bacterium]